MAEYSSSLFANRYRIETPPDDWDTGRSGLTYPAFDIVASRKVVIKRADVTSPQAEQHEHSLQNEAKALEILEGLGAPSLSVPKLYEKGSAEYGPRRFTYLVMEYIESKRIEANLEELTALDRAMILTELFRLLAKAHYRGVANGDVDIKHLFWSERKKLTVIDWGNASFGTGNHQESRCAYDMARASEIIYALVTKKSIVPPTGSLDLSEVELIPELAPLAEKYTTLCKWAPRNPSDGLAYSFTALEFYRVTLRWLRTVKPDYPAIDSELDEIISPRPSGKVSPRINYWIFLPVLLLVIVGVWIIFRYTLPGQTVDTATDTAFVQPSETPTDNLSLPPTNTNTVVIPATSLPTATSLPEVAHQPGSYNPILVFDEELSNPGCWDGSNFSRREDGIWQFIVPRTAEDGIVSSVDFSQCLNNQQVNQIAFNAWLMRLRPSTELGFFIENSKGLRREYTLWVENSDSTVYLKLRNEDSSEVNLRQLAIIPKYNSVYLNEYYQLSVVMVLEIDNQGLDLLYLSSPPGYEAMTTTELDSASKRVINGVTQPSLGDVTKLGLIAHGRDVKVLLWPLVFSGK